MSYVDSTGATSGQSTAAASAAGSSSAGLNQLDNSQTFLQLLVAQLKNQNPDNPTDPTSFMTEIAQLTAVQSQTSLNAEEQTVAADSMIGRSVNGNQSTGQQVSGTVTGVILTSSGAPELEVTGTSGLPTTIALDAVTKVYGGVTSATDPSASGSSTSNQSTTA